MTREARGRWGKGGGVGGGGRRRRWSECAGAAWGRGGGAGLAAPHAAAAAASSLCLLGLNAVFLERVYNSRFGHQIPRMRYDELFRWNVSLTGRGWI